MPIADLIGEPITITDGYPVGYGSVRLVVQLAKAPQDAVLGTFILGTSKLTSVGWVDITADVQGLTLRRGSEPGSRPGAGELKLRLRNQAGLYHPAQSSWYGPGTLLRVVLDEPGGNECLISAISISWEEVTDGNSRVQHVDVTALEPMALLREMNPPAVALYGAGDNPVSRIGFMLFQARWAFGFDDVGVRPFLDPVGLWTLQGSTLADDYLTELYKIADSLGLVALSNKDGSFKMAELDQGVVADSDALGTTIPIVADSIVTRNDDEQLLGSISVARTGGSAVTYTNTGVAGRYQTRSTQRMDLVTNNPGADADLARYAAIRLAQGRQTYRVAQFQLHSSHGPAVWELLRAMDIGTMATITKAETPSSGVLFTDYRICGYAMNIIRTRENKTTITASVQTDISGSSTDWSTY